MSEGLVLIQELAKSVGFSDCGISNIDLTEASEKLNQWLSLGHQGTMDYMARHGSLRYHPEALLPDAKSVIMVRMDYLCENPEWDVLDNPELGFISRYAQNRDYHKLIRARLVKLAEKLKLIYGDFSYRPTADSAPIMEKPLAVKAGLGWIGKHTNLINSKAGSYFFLGCLITSLDLDSLRGIQVFEESFSAFVSPLAGETGPKVKPRDREGDLVPKNTSQSHCGSCSKCLDICPTQAIIGPYQLDARRCISYLTIEHHGSIPIEFRSAMGNRIYGCDDCQIVCPWNKFAKTTQEKDFESLRNLKSPKLLELFSWSEAEFLKKTEGSAIRRIGYEKWIRNIAIALGNGNKTPEILKALNQKLLELGENLPIAREHIEWALDQMK